MILCFTPSVKGLSDRITTTKALVLAPFDGIQVDTFLYEFPQRAQLTQEVNSLFDSLEHIVDFCFCSKSTNAKSDTTVCTLITVTKCP